jgi:hypothetical protein
MSITGTYNGASIVQLPGGTTGSGSFRSVEFSMTDSVAVTTSPFTLQSSYYTWPGADLWAATCTLPPLIRSNADTWIAFLMELRGKGNCFLLGDPQKKAPRGSALGSPVVSGANLAGSQSLITSGWTANATGVLLVGDYFSLQSSAGSTRLHVVLDIVNASSSGTATISIWPSLREVPTGALVLIDPTGMFKLADNSRSFAASYDSTVAISFKCVEYR